MIGESHGTVTILSLGPDRWSLTKLIAKSWLKTPLFFGLELHSNCLFSLNWSESDALPESPTIAAMLLPHKLFYSTAPQSISQNPFVRRSRQALWSHFIHESIFFFLFVFFLLCILSSLYSSSMSSSTTTTSTTSSDTTASVVPYNPSSVNISNEIRDQYDVVKKLTLHSHFNLIRMVCWLSPFLTKIKQLHQQSTISHIC